MMYEEDALDDKSAERLEAEIRDHVNELKGFYIHMGLFTLINVFLITLNLITSPGTFWAIWPILGWGVGMGAHAVSVFGLFGLGTKAWEERKVREMMLQRQHGLNADQVRRLLREELRTGTRTATPDTTRLQRRLENLEAIVTSKAWDELGDPSDDDPPPPSKLSLDDTAPSPSDAPLRERSPRRTQ